jgi:hypothetical protein
LVIRFQKAEELRCCVASGAAPTALEFIGPGSQRLRAGLTSGAPPALKQGGRVPSKPELSQDLKAQRMPSGCVAAEVAARNAAELGCTQEIAGRGSL